MKMPLQVATDICALPSRQKIQVAEASGHGIHRACRPDTDPFENQTCVSAHLAQHLRDEF